MTPKENTFRAYTQDQGKHYAAFRFNYSPSLYQLVIDYHLSTGGQIDTLLDIGCGPGLATSGLSSHFKHAIGLDPSEGMLAAARNLGLITSTGEAVRFEIATAEDLGSTLMPPVSQSSVDLIVAANAAHWFDMDGFWNRAAKVLKPGGGVALWTSGEIRAHPSMPHAAAVQEAMDETYRKHLKQYEAPGNVLTRNRYIDLPLPWTLATPVPEFDEKSFVRKEWEVGEQFFTGPQESDLDTFEKAMATASSVTRWRNDHPEDVGTERDVVRMLRRTIERILDDGGPNSRKAMLKGDVRGVLLMVKTIA